MGFTGLAAALFLLLYSVKTESEKNAWQLDNYLHYALYALLFVAILSLGFAILYVVTDYKKSQQEHDGIKVDDNKNQELFDKNIDLLVKDLERLSSEHDRIIRELNSKHGELKNGQADILQTASEIRIAVNSIDSQLAVEHAKREAMIGAMTIDQQNVHSQINTIYALNQQLPALQLEKQQISEKYGDLQQQYDELKARYDQLKAEHQILQQKYQTLIDPPELSESEGFTQTLE